MARVEREVGGVERVSSLEVWKQGERFVRDG